jgi:PEGA domain
MQPSRRHCIYASLALLGLLFPAPRAVAETFKVTSSPAGATVEVNGSVAGTTPFQIDYPGGYFHKTHTVFGTKLEHSLTLRISKEGYLSQQVTLTEGPYEWVSVTGKHHGNYFLLKSDHFEIKLDPAPVGGNAVETINKEGPLHPLHPAQPLLPVASPPPSNDANAAQQSTGSVLISSDPPGAEIYIDGKFVGQTPSTIHLPSGSHRIEVKSQGKQLWERNLEVWKDSQLTLHPVLDEKP